MGAERTPVRPALYIRLPPVADILNDPPFVAIRPLPH
jgi:hypothetical protein